MPAAGDRVVRGGGQRQQNIEDRCLPGYLARTLDKKASRTIVEEGWVGWPQGRGDRGVRLMAGARDRVVTFVAILERARLDIEVPHDVEGFEQVKESMARQGRIFVDGLREVGGRTLVQVTEKRAQVRFENVGSAAHQGSRGKR